MELGSVKASESQPMKNRSPRRLVDWTSQSSETRAFSGQPDIGGCDELPIQTLFAAKRGKHNVSALQVLEDGLGRKKGSRLLTSMQICMPTKGKFQWRKDRFSLDSL